MHALQRDAAVADTYRADDPGGDVPGSEQRQRPIDIGGRDQGDHADAHVEGAVHLGLLDLAAGLHETKDRFRGPRRAVQRRGQVLGQDPGRTRQQVIDRILSTAAPLSDAGSGLVDARAALGIKALATATRGGTRPAKAGRPVAIAPAAPSSSLPAPRRAAPSRATCWCCAADSIASSPAQT